MVDRFSGIPENALGCEFDDLIWVLSAENKILINYMKGNEIQEITQDRDLPFSQLKDD